MTMSPETQRTELGRAANGLQNDATRIGRAWQDGMQALLGSYGDGLRRLSETGASLWNPRPGQGDQMREFITRLGEGTRELTSAQVAVAGEWLRAPFWFTGAASPSDLQARYFRLFEANRNLARLYLDAALGWQRSLSGAAEQATERALEAVDAQTHTAQRLANDAREAQQATVEMARETASKTRDISTQAASQVRETANRAVNEAREVVEETAERAERERRQAERARERERTETERVRRASREIRAHTGRGGEKIYYLPGQSGYERIDAEVTFATEDEAQEAGFRRAQTPGGGTVKGNINRDGERIYHLPGQANYDRIEAEMLFESAEQAEANGFRPAQR